MSKLNLLPSLLPMATAALSILAVPAMAASPDPLAPYRWTKRLLVVVGPSDRAPAVLDQRRLTAANRAGGVDRDLVVIEATGSDTRSDELRRRFGVAADGFKVLLIGKDGGVKIASDEPIAPERLFRDIDTMPMRQDEIRRRQP